MKNFLFGLASNPEHIFTISIAQVLEAVKGYAFNCIFLVTHGHVSFPEAATGVEGFWKTFDVIGVNTKDSYIATGLAVIRRRACGVHLSEISGIQTRFSFLGKRAYLYYPFPFIHLCSFDSFFVNWYSFAEKSRDNDG